MHGGVEMAITALSNALVRRGYEVEILCTYNLGTPAYPLDSRVQVRYLTQVRPNRKNSSRRCSKRISRESSVRDFMQSAFCG